MKSTLIIPSYNRARLLDKTLTRIKSFDYVPDEILVIDDGSQDVTKDIAYKHDVRYIFLNAPYFRGCSIPKNVGIRNATYDVVMFSEPELFWITPVAQQFMEYLEKDSKRCYSAGTIYTFQPEIDDEDPLEALRTHRVYNHREYGYHLENQIMELTNWQALWTWAILKEHLFAVGGYDERMSANWGFDDHDAGTRLRCYGVHQTIQEDIKAIHLYHDKVPPEKQDSWAENEKIFLEKKCDDFPENIVSNRGVEWGRIA